MEPKMEQEAGGRSMGSTVETRAKWTVAESRGRGNEPTSEARAEGKPQVREAHKAVKRSKMRMDSHRSGKTRHGDNS